MSATDPRFKDKRTIVVVGPCAAGKSTLVAGLRRAGFNARVCAQEHSEISTLWSRGHPDVVIALDVDLPTIRKRRGQEWPETIYLAQKRRLTAARAAADLVVDTSVTDTEATLAIVLSLLGH